MIESPFITQESKDAKKWDLLVHGLRNTASVMKDHGYSNNMVKRKFCRALMIAKFFVDAIDQQVEGHFEPDHRKAWQAAVTDYEEWREEALRAQLERNRRMNRRVRR